MGMILAFEELPAYVHPRDDSPLLPIVGDFLDIVFDRRASMSDASYKRWCDELAAAHSIVQFEPPSSIDGFAVHGVLVQGTIVSLRTWRAKKRELLKPLAMTVKAHREIEKKKKGDPVTAPRRRVTLRRSAPARR
tara:strand:- start:1177 stop:1581 length:405 start_codon:yes stop_codon:yes gene_type:complete